MATSGSASLNPTSDPTTYTTTDNYSFNFVFLLIPLAALLVFLGLLYLTRRTKSARVASLTTGRDALAEDVESMAGSCGMSHINPQPCEEVILRQQIVMRQQGLDEMGEAPPSYSAVEGDKPPELTPMATRVGAAREGWVTIEMMGTSGERTSERMRETSLDRFCGERVPATTVTRLNAQGTTYGQSYLPAAYIETGASHDNVDAVTRPAAAAILPVRSSDIDLEGQTAK
jgi:hypothetical protein